MALQVPYQAKVLHSAARFAVRVGILETRVCDNAMCVYVYVFVCVCEETIEIHVLYNKTTIYYNLETGQGKRETTCLGMDQL